MDFQYIIEPIVTALFIVLLAKFFPASKGKHSPLPKVQYEALIKKYSKRDALLGIFALLPLMAILCVIYGAIFYFISTALTFKTKDTMFIMGLPLIAWMVPGTLLSFGTIFKAMDIAVNLLIKKDIEEYKAYTISKYIYQYKFDSEKLEKYWLRFFMLLTFICLVVFSDWSITITKDKFKYHQFGFRHNDYTFSEIDKLQVIEAYVNKNKRVDKGPYYVATFKDKNYWNSRAEFESDNVVEVISYLSEKSGKKIEQLGVVIKK